MKNFSQRFLLAVILLVGSFAALAAAPNDAVVDSVQMPAWLERRGVVQPLEPGMVLRNRDRVLTGGGARVLIALAEGSAVKLGEQAQLDVNALGRRDGGVFTAALDVTRGALRFTSGVFAKPRSPRAVNVRLATITAGIRGTDLWGKSDDERDVLCLLEGRIGVFHPLDEAREMSEPMSLYVAAKDAAPAAPSQTDGESVAAWLAQTEIEPGSGYARRGGLWKVELASAATSADALALYDLARAAGYAARIKPRRGDADGYRYSIRVGRLPSSVEARALAEKLGASFAWADPRVTRH